MNISLNNIREHTIPFHDYKANWLFREDEHESTSPEHQDQIWILNREASQFLWDHELKSGIVCSEQYFTEIILFDSSASGIKEKKKFLYNLGIPFHQKVFLPVQPHTGFVLTWKMVIKYSHNLFFYEDQSVWDRSMNWKLEYHHDGEFAFGRGIRV